MGKCKLFRAMKAKGEGMKFFRYLRELSVVIIGVAVTFIVSGLISDAKDRKDLNMQLDAIYMELEKNVVKLDELIQMHENHKLLANALEEYLSDPKEEAMDSLDKYSFVINELPSFNYHRSAYEMFVNSGAMKLMNNRQLLLNITETYIMLENTKDELELYKASKHNEARKIYDTDPWKAMNVGRDITDRAFWGLINFYISVSMGECGKETKKQIEKVLAEMKNKK